MYFGTLGPIRTRHNQNVFCTVTTCHEFLIIINVGFSWDRIILNSNINIRWQECGLSILRTVSFLNRTYRFFTPFKIMDYHIVSMVAQEWIIYKITLLLLFKAYFRTLSLLPKSEWYCANNSTINFPGFGISFRVLKTSSSPTTRS